MKNNIVIEETFTINSLFDMFRDGIIVFNEEDTIQDDFESSIVIENLINNKETFDISLLRKSDYNYLVVKEGKKLSSVLRYLMNQYSLKLRDKDLNMCLFYELNTEIQLFLKIRKIKASITIDEYKDYYIETIKRKYNN